MANKYLISAMVDSVETFYTANPDGTIESIGTNIDWDKGFDEYTLSCIDNTVYSSLEDGKVWVNNNSTMAIEDETNEGYVYSTDQTAIDCTGYSNITKLSVSGPTSAAKSNIKIAISFNNRNVYYTRGSGYVASNTVAIPYTAANRASSGVIIDEDNFAAAFDNSTSTILTLHEPSGIIPVEFNNKIVARKYTISVPQTCRLPLITKFQVYDAETSNWVTLDEIIIKASKTITRYFDNEINAISYRWVFDTDPSDLGDDPTRTIDITELNVYGRTTGTVWIPLKDPKEVKEKGLTITQLEALTSSDYTQIFNQGQIDFVMYIPSSTTSSDYYINNITATFPKNGAPVIEYFRAVVNKIHAGDVDVIFKFSDPEKGNVNYNIYVNDELVIAKYDVASGTEGRETIPNSAFKEIDETDTEEIEATNIIRFEVEDEYGASSSETYMVTKVDRLPTVVGVLDQDAYRYTFTINDSDKGDKVKYSAYLNDIESPISSSEFMDVPIRELSFDIPQNHIRIGENNTLRVIVEDNVSGKVTILLNFVGTYPSLLFFDDNNDILSNNFGEVLKNLNLGSILCGQVSQPTRVKITNNTSKAVRDLVISSPRDIDGTDSSIKDDNDVTVDRQHKDGTLWIQLSFEENFTDPNTYYAINIPALASHESKYFYIRAQSTSSLAAPKTYDDVKINATSFVV